MDLTRCQILLVEDDEVDVMNIQMAFKKANLLNKVTITSDGQEAVEALRSGEIKKPLLILLDINMPRMSGLEFLRWLRQDETWNLTPVVVLTTSNADRDKVEAYKAGVAGYIVKPIEIGDFVETVAKIGNYWSICEFPTHVV